MRTLCFLALLASPIAADVLTVGIPGSGSDFEQIQPAIDSANSGDVVLVGPGTFDAFVLTKPLLVQGAGPGLTSVVAQNVPGGPFTGFTAVMGNLGPGETAAMAGMSFELPPGLVAALPMIWMADSEGSLFLHDVEVTSYLESLVDAQSVEAVVISQSRFTGPSAPVATGQPSLAIADSNLWLVDSEVEKPWMESFFPDFESFGISLVGSTGFLAGTRVQGQSYLSPGLNTGGDALRLQSSSCTAERVELLGGDGSATVALESAPGGFGVSMILSSTLRFGRQFLVQGGLDGLLLAQQEAISAPVGSEVTFAESAFPTLSASPPAAQAGDSLDLTLHGSPGDAGLVFASLQPGVATSFVDVGGTAFIDLTAPITLGAFTLDASGQRTLSGTAPMVLEPTLFTVQWVRIGSRVDLSTPAFVSLR